MPDPLLPDREAVRAALARASYAAGRVRLAPASLAGADCLVASRQGLFAVARDGTVTEVAHGHFFGLRALGDAIYAFEACDRPHAPSRMGRIVRLRRDGDRLLEPVVLACGLDNRCHQLAVSDEGLWVVDTADQTVLQFTLDGRPVARHRPLASVQGYRHPNSIARIGDRFALLLHNGAGGPARPSELMWFDRQWRVTACDILPAFGCHDIVADEAGRIWHCGSLAGELIHSGGLRHKVSERMTRGLAVMPHRIVVGSSDYARRETRAAATGSVHFLTRELAVESEVAVPAAPTDLIPL